MFGVYLLVFILLIFCFACVVVFVIMLLCCFICCGYLICVCFVVDSLLCLLCICIWFFMMLIVSLFGFYLYFIVTIRIDLNVYCLWFIVWLFDCCLCLLMADRWLFALFVLIDLLVLLNNLGVNFEAGGFASVFVLGCVYFGVVRGLYFNLELVILACSYVVCFYCWFAWCVL